MNIELLTRIAEALEATPDINARVPHTHVGFNMRHFETAAPGTECGTTCCIGGLACLFSGLPTLVGDAQDVLGLSARQAHQLFYGEQDGTNVVELSEITRQHAARTIRNLIATGEVVWGQP